MIINLTHRGISYRVDLSQPRDISIPLIPNEENVNCFHAPQPRSEPVRSGDFVGSIEEGGLLNFKNLHVNIHGNGTHTECVEHISNQGTSINQALNKYHFIGQLITIKPEGIGTDTVITKNNIKEKFDFNFQHEALIIRTLPNTNDKLVKNYSGINPTYCDPSAIQWIKGQGIKHLLIDLPSVDKEQDEGKLLAHKTFWNVPDNPELNHTITELIYVPDEIEDGIYLVNIQISSLEMDACLSKVVLYRLGE